MERAGRSLTADPPVVRGRCIYCESRASTAGAAAALYADQPLVVFPDGRLAHVACEIDARRRGVSGLI
jgi:hypothetical protein